MSKDLVIKVNSQKYLLNDDLSVNIIFNNVSHKRLPRKLKKKLKNNKDSQFIDDWIKRKDELWQSIE